MGHPGHEGMSMDDMVRDMRNRFVVAAIFSVPILLWSPIGRDVLGFDVAAPFGLRDDVWSLLLSLPVVFYASSIFFTGAWHALRARTLDMMVLVAVAIGAGWLYSVGVTLTGGGEVFYEAASVLATFVLLGHWFEMRARGGANDAIRSLLDLAPPMAVVIRDGREVEVPTAEVRGRRSSPHPTGRQGAGRRHGRGRRERRRRVDGHRREPSRAQGAGRRGDRRHDQPQRHPARPSDEGRCRHCAGADRAARAGGAELEGPRPATRRPRRVLARPGRAARRRGHVPRVGDLQRPADRRRFALRDHRRRHHVPGCSRPRHPHGDHGRYWARRERGVLFKHATAIETAARIDVVVMDKTGTLTKGEPEVTDTVFAPGQDTAEMLALVAAVERESEHPLAEAITTYAEAQGARRVDVTSFEAVPGHGAVGVVAGSRVAVGNLRLMDREGVELGTLATKLAPSPTRAGPLSSPRSMGRPSPCSASPTPHVRPRLPRCRHSTTPVSRS